MSDEAKTAEMESVTAFTWMLKAGLPFQIMKCEDGWYAEVYTKDRWPYGIGDTLMEAMQDLAKKLPDVFDPAKGDKD